MKKIIKISIFLLIIIGLIIGAVILVKKRKAEDANQPTAQIYPINVTAISPKKGHIITTLPYLAIVKNDKNVNITTKFAGKIKCIANLGGYVTKGQRVVEIDNSDLKAKLKEVNAKIKAIKGKIEAENIALQNLLATHERTKKLLKVKMASIEQYQTEESKIAALKAQIKADKDSLNALYSQKNAIINDLKYTVIKSPINGIISQKFANKGDLAFPGRPILQISSNKGTYLFIALPKKEKKIIYKNKIYPLINLHSTFNGLLSFKAKVNDKNLVAGEKVKIKVVTFDGNATLIPYSALLSINGKNYVFDTDGKAHKIDVIAEGSEGVVTDSKIEFDIIQASPDILLKIKAGYPIKIEN